MTVVYAGWSSPLFSYRRNDTYYGSRHILMLGPWIFFIGAMTKDEIIAAIDAEDQSN